jgi:hypothetical protein
MLAKCTGDTGLDGLACVLGDGCLGRGVLWVGAGESTAVGSLQRGRRRREGGPGAVLCFLPCRTAWVGAEGAGVDRGGVQEHGYRLETDGDSDPHSDHDLFDFHRPGVRRNARKRFKFEILKISTLGDQHIDQGFQSYFCYKEMLSFAEILFQNFGIVTVSDSKFG